MKFTLFGCLKTPETCHKVSKSVIVSTLHLELTNLVDNLFVLTYFLGSGATFLISYNYADLPVLSSKV